MPSSSFNKGQTGNATEVGAGIVKLATQQQVNDRVAEDGGVPLVVTPDKVAPSGIIELEAAFDFAEGDAVGAASQFPDKAGPARSHIRWATRSGSSFSNNARRSDNRAVIGDNKIVQGCNVGTGAYQGFVTEYDPVAGTATHGSEYEIATGLITDLRVSSIAPLDNDKFIIVYGRTFNSQFIRYRICTVSGTVISPGPEQTLYTTTGGTVNNITVSQIETDKVVVSIKSSDNTASAILCATVSGTTLTAGTAIVLVGSNLSFDVPTLIQRLDTDKFVLLNELNDDMYGKVGTISGTTITLGSDYKLGSTVVGGSNAGHLYSCSPETDKFVVRWEYSGNNINLVAASVSGTVITAGTVRENWGSTAIGFGNIIAVSPTEVWVVGGGNVSRGGRFHPITLSGNNIVGEPRTASNQQFQLDAEILRMPGNGGYWAGAFAAISTYAWYWIEGFANNFLGFASETVSQGQTVRVQVSGVVGGFTDLVPGSYYYFDAGTPPSTASGIKQINNDVDGTSKETDETFIAKSETEVIL